MQTVKQAVRKLATAAANLAKPYTVIAYEDLTATMGCKYLRGWAQHRAYTYAGACAWGRLYCGNTTKQVRIYTRSGRVVGGATLL